MTSITLKTVSAADALHQTTSAFVRGSGSGIVTGMEIVHVPQSLELQIMPGKCVVNGCLFETTSINNLFPPASMPIVDGMRVMVCVRVSRTETVGLNRWNQRVALSTGIGFEFFAQDVLDYVEDADVLVLGICSYNIALRDTSIASNAPVQLPVNVIGIFPSIPDANTKVFGTSTITPFTNTDNTHTGDSVVVSTNTGTNVGVGTVLEVYEWKAVQDPVTATYSRFTVAGQDTRKNLQTTQLETEYLYNTGFVVQESVNGKVCVTYNVRDRGYAAMFTIPGINVGNVPTTITVYSSESPDPITVEGIVSWYPTMDASLTFTYRFPGGLYEHETQVSWNPYTPTSTEVTGLWSNIGSLQMLSFAYQDTHWFTLPWNKFEWVLATNKSSVAGNDGSYYYSIIGITADVDMSRTVYDFIRPIFSGIDTVHRSQNTGFETPSNPHGIGFNDIGYGTSMPLHKQLFDSGFGVAVMDTHGIVGRKYTEYIAHENVKTDYFGTTTDVLVNRYVQLQHVPLNVSRLTNAVTGSDVPYSILNDVVVLGPDFVAGDMNIYPRFVKTLMYAVGTRVTYDDNGFVRVYTTKQIWMPNTAASSNPADLTAYFTELSQVSLVCEYFYIPDLEYTNSSDNLISFARNNNDPVVTEGFVVEPTSSTDPLQFNLGQYKGINIPKMTLSLSGQGTIVSTEHVIDAADLGTRQSSQQSLQATVSGASQVKAYLTRTPYTKQVAPLQGYLSIQSKAFYGHVRLFYTYSLPETVMFSTQTQVSSFHGNLNLDGAQLMDGVNYIPRDSWEFSYATNQVTIASDVFVPGRTYRLVRRAMESQRNMSGIIDVVGTRPKPVGVFAEATLTADDNARFAIGDAITLVHGDYTITKTLQATAGFTGFVKGASLEATFDSIIQAFRADPLFARTGASIYASAELANTLVFRAGTDGVAGNDYQLTATSQNTSMLVTKFENGADHAWNLDDLAGLVYTINESVLYDMNGYFSLWSTGDIDTGSDRNTFYRVSILNDQNSGYIQDTLGQQSGPSVLVVDNWVSGNGWLGDSTAGFTHYSGLTDTLVNSTLYSIGPMYRVSVTVQGYRSGSFKLTVGGRSYTLKTSTVLETSFTDASDPLTIIPSRDFEGTLLVDVAYIADYYDASQELGLSVQVTGEDSEGNTLQETLEFDFNVFCDIQNPRMDNSYSNVRSKNLYSKLTSWSVLNSNNVGSSQLTLIAESSSGTRDLFDLCDLSWNGSGTRWIRDRRRFVDAYTNKPTTDTVSEALSAVVSLLQFQVESTEQGN